MASLIVTSGKSSGSYYQLESTTVSVGRDEGCDLQVIDDLVSRRHLEVGYDPESRSYQAVDMDSANGVFIHGERISDPAPLHDGDVIQIGDSRLLFTIREFADGEAAINFYKQRGERGKSTFISAPDTDTGS